MRGSEAKGLSQEQCWDVELGVITMSRLFPVFQDILGKICILIEVLDFTSLFYPTTELIESNYGVRLTVFCF